MIDLRAKAQRNQLPVGAFARTTAQAIARGRRSLHLVLLRIARLGVRSTNTVCSSSASYLLIFALGADIPDSACG